MDIRAHHVSYAVDDILDRVTVPQLVMQYELVAIAASQTRQVYDGLASKHK